MIPVVRASASRGPLVYPFSKGVGGPSPAGVVISSKSSFHGYFLDTNL